VRFNSDVYAYMNDMSTAQRRHLRGAAREVDEDHVFSNFRQEYAVANDTAAAQKQVATDQRKERADKKFTDLQAFKPVFRLGEILFKDDRVTRMKTQLKWHREIDGDKDIPKNFHDFNKQKLWDTMNEAIEKRQKKDPGCNGK